MQAELEAILKMSDTLESANFTGDQSDALMQSMALAMRTFAVTPEILDERLDNLRREWKQDLKGVNHRLDGIETRLDGIETRLAKQEKSTEGLKKDIEQLKVSMNRLERSLLRYFLAFVFTTFTGLIGIFGAVLAF